MAEIRNISLPKLSYTVLKSSGKDSFRDDWEHRSYQGESVIRAKKQLLEWLRADGGF